MSGIRARCGFVILVSLVATSAAQAQGRAPHSIKPNTKPTTPVSTAAAKPPPTAAHVTKPVPVGVRIEHNPALAGRLQALLPTGMTLDAAANGFRNRGQFIAALHASRDFNIPFDKLKAEMVRPDHDSLGQAIHDLRPRVDTRAAVQRAEREAKEDLTATRLKRTPDGDHDDRGDRNNQGDRNDTR